MNPASALKFLAEIGFIPGLHRTKHHAKRHQIKAAIVVLKAAGRLIGAILHLKDDLKKKKDQKDKKE